MALPVFLLGSLCVVIAAELSISKQTNGEVALSMPATAGTFYRIEATGDFAQWTPMMTLHGGTTIQHTDSAVPYFAKRFYRSTELSGAGHLMGDHFQTIAGEVIIHPVNHASFVMSWNGKMIYSDPVGATTLYSGFRERREKSDQLNQLSVSEERSAKHRGNSQAAKNVHVRSMGTPF